VKSVLQVLEHRDTLQEMLEEIDDPHGVKVRIGHENRREEIKNCSVVVATYSFNDRPAGKIGVLGPTRMNYSKVVGSVKSMANFLSNFLTDTNK
jgi:heat-inducible transcriptional repressor